MHFNKVKTRGSSDLVSFVGNGTWLCVRSIPHALGRRCVIMFGSSFTCIAVEFSLSIFVFSVCVCLEGSGEWVDGYPLQLCYCSLPFFLPSSCPLFISLIHIGGHDWVTRICQPWELSPSRGWLLIAEVLGLCEVFVINL